jgi:hypothetical protein
VTHYQGKSASSTVSSTSPPGSARVEFIPGTHTQLAPSSMAAANAAEDDSIALDYAAKGDDEKKNAMTQLKTTIEVSYSAHST